MSLTLSQVKIAVQTGLAGASSIFSLNPASQELDTLSTNLATLTALLQEGTPSLLRGAKNLPQGIAVGVSFVRATSAVKKLNAPIPADQASAILNSFTVVQTKTLAFVALFKSDSSSYEGVMPGIYQYGLSTLQGLFNSLANAVAAVDPTSIPPGKVQQLQSSVTASIAL